MKLTWYFDFISPFAYLQFQRFSELPDDIEIEYKPILFAGLLNHWKNVGPAEIAPKRTFTYKYCYWYARKNAISFTMPPAHPFNSLAALRLAIATENQQDSIGSIFDTIWKEGLAIGSQEANQYLNRRLKTFELNSIITQQSIKDRLIKNTQDAADASVFGVPSFVVNDGSDELFWGMDSFEMLLDYLQSPSQFYDAEMRRIIELPEGIQRKR